jgi:hypothetical protein
LCQACIGCGLVVKPGGCNIAVLKLIIAAAE